MRSAEIGYSMDRKQLLAIWEDTTKRRLDPTLRILFLKRAELKEIAKFNILFIEEAARLAVVGDVLKLEAWLGRCHSVAASPPSHVRQALSAEAPKQPSGKRSGGDYPRRRPSRRSDTPPGAGARYGGMVNPAPADADLHKKIGRANKGEKYQG